MRGDREHRRANLCDHGVEPAEQNRCGRTLHGQRRCRGRQSSQGHDPRSFAQELFRELRPLAQKVPRPVGAQDATKDQRTHVRVQESDRVQLGGGGLLAGREGQHERPGHGGLADRNDVRANLQSDPYEGSIRVPRRLRLPLDRWRHWHSRLCGERHQNRRRDHGANRTISPRISPDSGGHDPRNLHGAHDWVGQRKAEHVQCFERRDVGFVEGDSGRPVPMGIASRGGHLPQGHHEGSSPESIR
mmetsp:Transcript_22349/g.62174  ORF Transcript_22349/g.62174 Transcript_22349/m.62174 type:complete len:245 (+) Transcript_22349:1016-1750(+)